MTALLERLNASRRFARSVYAPHKLALRQSVPLPLRAVGVTAPAAPVSSAPRSVAPRVMPTVVTRALPSPVLRPNSAALEPRFVTNLESQGSLNLESQGSLNPESQRVFDSEPQDSVNLERPLSAAAFPEVSPPFESVQEPSLELAAPIEVESSGPLNGDVIAQAPLAQPFFDQPDPTRATLSAPLEPRVEPIAPAMPAAERPVNLPTARASAALLESVGERSGLAQENEPIPTLPTEISPEIARVAEATAMPVTSVAPPAQPLEEQPQRADSLSLEPQFDAADLEVAEAALTVQGAATLEARLLETELLEPAPAPVASEPEMIAPLVAAVTLEAAAPVALDPIADQPVLDPILTPARGRVIEEFQARPPRNMPPRNQPPRAVEAVTEATVDDAPLRSPEEWARLLRQRYAQSGDEAFDDAVTPSAPVALEAAQFGAAPLETAPSNSSVSAASPEPRAGFDPQPLTGQTAVSGAPAAGSSEAEAIRERSLAALQAIPEDMTKRSPRDWGLALIRRYTSADEAAAIGIEAYRDPSDAAAEQTSPSEPAQSVAPRATVPSLASSSLASSSAEPAAPVGLEAAARPARRFVAPRVVSSTAPSLGSVAPAQAQTVRAQPLQPASAQRNALSPTPLEQSSAALEAAPRIPSEPNRSASSPLLSPRVEQQAPTADALLQPALETGDFIALQTEAAPADVDDGQMNGAATRPASDAAHSPDVALSAAPQSAAANLEPALPEPLNLEPLNLEPVTLSGATRRFLEPLVGFDPNEVSVYTGEAASRVTRDLCADAAALHGAVLLPDASNLETPAQLGLLAHELIHVAEQQQSAQPDANLEPTIESPFQTSSLEPTRPFEAVSRRFVPAVGSSDTRGAAQIPAQPSPVQSSNPVQSSSPTQSSNPVQSSNAVRQSSAPINQGISTFASEEDRARAAEARVTQIARAGPLSAMPTSAGTKAAASSSWNGLPAPWESLPSFESSSSDDNVVSLVGAGLSPQAWGGRATTNPSGYGGSVSSSNPSVTSSGSSAPDSSAPGSSASSSAASSVAAAETGRELPSDGGGAAASPDLEQLAKQVYDVLKRRLQSDRRRGGL